MIAVATWLTTTHFLVSLELVISGISSLADVERNTWPITLTSAHQQIERRCNDTCEHNRYEKPGMSLNKIQQQLSAALAHDESLPAPSTLYSPSITISQASQQTNSPRTPRNARPSPTPPARLAMLNRCSDCRVPNLSPPRILRSRRSELRLRSGYAGQAPRSRSGSVAMPTQAAQSDREAWLKKIQFTGSAQFIQLHHGRSITTLPTFICCLHHTFSVLRFPFSRPCSSISFFQTQRSF